MEDIKFVSRVGTAILHEQLNVRKVAYWWTPSLSENQKQLQLEW